MKAFAEASAKLGQLKPASLFHVQREAEPSTGAESGTTAQHSSKNDPGDRRMRLYTYRYIEITCVKNAYDFCFHFQYSVSFTN